MLMTIREYIDTHFAEASRPKPCTVRRWIEQGRLTYRIERMGNTIYIDTAVRLTGDDLVDRVLNT